MYYSFICLMCILSTSLYASQKQQQRSKIYQPLEALYENTGKMPVVRALAIGEMIRRSSSGDSASESVDESQNQKPSYYILANTPKKHEKHSQAQDAVYNAQFKAQNYSKKTRSLLFVEAAKKKENVKPFLQDKELDFNQQDGEGKTALMYVVEQGLHDIAEILMERGARAFSIKDLNKSEHYPAGRCAYDYAANCPQLQEIIWKRQEEDRKRRNADIKRRSSMSDIFELFQQAPVEEDLYVQSPKLLESKEDEGSQG